MPIENFKNYNLLSIVLGFPGICFLMAGHVLNQLLISILGIILFILGMIFYGKAKQRGLLWFLFLLPLMIGFLLYNVVS